MRVVWCLRFISVCVFVGGAQRFVCFDMKMINEWRFKDES